MEFVEGSITDLDLLMETFPGAAGTLPAKDPLPSNEANVTGTTKDCGVPAVVAASSSSVYGDTPDAGIIPAHSTLIIWW